MEVSQFPWLTAMVALPALGAALLGLVPALRRSAGRAVALAVSAAELVLALVVAATRFDWSAPASYQVTDSLKWIPQLGISWSLSVSALSLVMVLLATALVPLVLVAGWDEEEPADQGAYPALVLALESFMVTIFTAWDLAVFYFAFEAMLVPLYLMIGRYGVGGEAARHRAAMKFLLYSLFGGLVMLG
ncbi:MAG: NADH-quinone oxidoreductase subunit M, partial [Schaalia georgiae]|nr:NADH-quinone oxidoreductase subunit M [Schaalia georgiae]